MSQYNYKVLVGISTNDLENLVNECLRSGYKTVGGVAVVFDGEGFVFYQAVALEAETRHVPSNAHPFGAFPPVRTTTGPLTA